MRECKPCEGFGISDVGFEISEYLKNQWLAAIHNPKSPSRLSTKQPKEQQLTFDSTRPATDYFQYLVLILDSDATEPLVP